MIRHRIVKNIYWQLALLFATVYSNAKGLIESQIIVGQRKKKTRLAYPQGMSNLVFISPLPISKGSIINIGATHIRVVANILFLQ